jgi:hypothetical protein
MESGISESSLDRVSWYLVKKCRSFHSQSSHACFFFGDNYIKGKLCKVCLLEVVKISLSTRFLSGSSDDGSGGSGSLGLVLGFGLLRLGDLVLLGSLLGGLLSGSGGGRSLLLLLDGLLLLGLLGRLVLRLGGALALDGSTELGERALAGLLLALGAGAGRLVTLAKGEGQGRLALLLVLLGLAVGHSSLSGLSGDGGRAADIDGQGSGGLDGRDDGGGLGGGGSLLLLLGRLSLGLGLGGLLLLLGEDVAEEAGALVDGRLLLGRLGLGLLSGLGLALGSGLSDSGDLLSGRSLTLGNGLDNDGSLGSSGLLSLGLVLLLLLLAKAEERSALAASGAALRLLDLKLVLGLLLGGGGGGALLLSSRLVGLGGSLLSGGGLVLGGLDLVLLGSGLEALNGLLVDLRLSDGGGKLLGLGNLGLQLGNPVVALSGGVGLEGVLVALGGEVELVRAVGLRLGGISLQDSRVSYMIKTAAARCASRRRPPTRLMTPWGAFLSPMNKRPLPVWAAQAMLCWATSTCFSAFL